MNCIRLLFLALLLFGNSLSLWSQETNENKFEEEEVIESVNKIWVPSLLNASPSPLFNLIAFNGRIFSWNWRGDQSLVNIVDGIHWNVDRLAWSGQYLTIGLNEVFKRKEVLINGAFSNNGYWNKSNLSIVSSENTEDKKSLTLAAALSNVNEWYHASSFYLLGRSGPLRNNIKWTYAAKYEAAPFGVMPIGFKQAAHLFIGLDKNFGKSSFGFSFLWNYANQGKASTTVNEMFNLSNQRNYNPNWGWYHQQPYFPSTRQTNVPMISFRFQKKWDQFNVIYLNNGILFGKEAQSNLEWTNTADPRPDYYKYLPSYATDTILKAQLTDWFIAHPSLLQIQFDALERVNSASEGHRSFYIINQQNKALRMMHGSLMYAHLFKNRAQLQAGVNYALDQIHYYNTIKDLLGGSFYYNYNGWMNDDEVALSFQFDIANPNKKLKQGDKWGADYVMRSFLFKPWVQWQKQGPVIETAMAMGYGWEGVSRIGYQQNGLFVNSKGESGFRNFFTADAKAQLLYKVNGRIYLKSIVFAKWLGPQTNSVFIDPTMNAFASPYSMPSSNFGADMQFFYRAPSFKTSLSVYQQFNFNESENKLFYHDAYAIFVYGLIGYMQSAQNGIEYTAETSLLQNCKFTYVATLSNSYYLDNPQYQYLDVNTLSIKEGGRLQIKNLTKDSGPKFVNAISFIYQPASNFTFGLTSVLAQARPVSMNLFRRSEWVKNKVDPITWGQIQNVSLLKDQITTNLFFTKFFQLKSQNAINKVYRWNMRFSARNIFNTLIPIWVYEQTRFDFLRFNKEKFALKYLMDGGASFSFRLQLQIQ